LPSTHSEEDSKEKLVIGGGGRGGIPRILDPKFWLAEPIGGQKIGREFRIQFSAFLRGNEEAVNKPSTRFSDGEGVKSLNQSVSLFLSPSL